LSDDGRIQLIVGLGNPGEDYLGSRHNIGFSVVDNLARRHAASAWKTGETHRETAVRIGGRMVVLACPLTFMNRSGLAVKALIDGAGCRPAEVLVIVDDIDLELGRLRFRRKGGPGTHNGLRSICEAVGVDFARLRVGVRGSDVWTDLAAYVLSPFPEAEVPLVDRVVSQCSEAVEIAVESGIPEAMNRFNGLRIEAQEDTVGEEEAGGTWADARPRRLAEWVEVDGNVVIECLRPSGRGLRNVPEWFRWWMGPQRIRLDAIGSAIWRHLDGRTTLGMIVEELAETMEDDGEHLANRIDLFVRTLVGQGLLRIDE
jgi:PTH1 family peptidyl-tRNA hydrolase